MINRSSSSMVSNPIICCFVTHWGSTTHGMRRPQHKKTVRTYRPLERGIQGKYHATCLEERHMLVTRARRLPTQTVLIEVSRPCQIGDAQGNQTDALFHRECLLREADCC